MKNDTFSYAYYRQIPNIFLKQGLKEIHRKLKSELINIEIARGILISIFAIGVDNCNEIIFIKSSHRLSTFEVKEIVNELNDLEVYFFKQIKNSQRSYEISCYGVTTQSFLQNIDFQKYFNSNFQNWDDYSVHYYDNAKSKVDKNYRVDNGELSYIGFLNSNILIRSPDDLISVKLIEEIFKLKGSVLNKIRNQGLCYTTVSKFHEDLNIIYIGIVASYSQELLNKLNKLFNRVEISIDDFIRAKESLKREIIFSTTLYQSEHYLLPYRILNPNVDIAMLLNLTNQIEFEDIIRLFYKREFVCLKIS